MEQETVVTIGTFDGVHRGHQAILTEVRAEAASRRLSALALAFEAPPRQRSSGRLLLPLDLKNVLLRRWVDRVHPIAFSEVEHLSPDRFVDEMLVRSVRARVIVVGTGFRFGRGRVGTVDRLKALAAPAGIDVRDVPPVALDGDVVSSTRIRRLVASGNVEAARPLLGRPPLLLASIVAGDRLGRRMGYPTANLDLPSSILRPADGIYIVDTYAGGVHHPGLLYVGRRPTFEPSPPRCEIHLLDGPQPDLYGRMMEVHLLRRLRGDRKFAGIEELGRQIEDDVRSARALRRALLPPAGSFVG